MSRRIRRAIKRAGKAKFSHLPRPNEEQQVFAGLDSEAPDSYVGARCEFCGNFADMKFGKCQKLECQIERVKRMADERTKRPREGK